MATVEKPGPAGQLVGRDAERQAIARALDEVGSGNPRVVWVEGDAGLGKTALVRHVVGHLPAEMQVTHAQGDELATERPFELARQLGSTSSESFSAGMEILEHGPNVKTRDRSWSSLKTFIGPTGRRRRRCSRPSSGSTGSGRRARHDSTGTAQRVGAPPFRSRTLPRY